MLCEIYDLSCFGGFMPVQRMVNNLAYRGNVGGLKRRHAPKVPQIL